MNRAPQFEDLLGPLAAAVVREVTTRGEASVAEVAEALRRRRGGPLAYTTVMTVMRRLYEKGVLARDWRGRQHVYRGSGPEPEVVDRLTRIAVDRVVERYGTAALRAFAVRLADIDPEMRGRLEALADESE